MDNIKNFLKQNIRQYTMALALVVIMVFFQILTDGVLFKPMNVTNLILQNSYVLILAVGMLIVILTGNVDLSVGSVAAFIGAISAIFMVRMNMPVALAVILCLIIGALVGAWQGFWIAYVRIPAFIVTLAGMLIFRGLTMVILKGQTIAPFPDSFAVAANGFLPESLKIGNLNLIAVLAGLLLSVLYVFMTIKQINNRKKYNIEGEPIGFTMFITGIVVVAINLFTMSLANYKGINLYIHNRKNNCRTSCICTWRK
jgi:putative multiple sugar transport system permease protein